MVGSAQASVQADPMLVRCLTLHQTVLDHSPAGLTKEEIYTRVDGYAGRFREAQFLDEEQRERELAALERRFSDDKQYLRAAGIPLLESEDVTGEHRYRIPADEYGLPDLQLTDQERLALHAAQLQFASDSIRGLQHALWALTPQGAEPGEGPARSTAHASLGTEAELDHLLEIGMLGMGAPVSFSYTARGRFQPEKRRVVPLALGARGHWYLIAEDLDRKAQRIFRLDRMHGPIQPLGRSALSAEEARRAAACQPDQVDAETILNGLTPGQQRRDALASVVEVHSRPAPDPGRLRPVTAETRRDTIALKTDRVINMAAYLLATGGARPSELLNRYGITAEQLQRDLLSLEQSGPNVGMSRYVTVDPEVPLDRKSFVEEYLGADDPVTLSIPGGASAEALHRPVSLTKPGALSLLIALSLMIAEADQQDPLAQAARSLKAKVLSIVPESIASAAESLSLQPPAGPDHAAQARRAVKDGCAVQLDYTDADGTSSRRTVEPVQLLYDGPYTYLRAWCRKASGERLFRMDRISSLHPQPEDPRSDEAWALLDQQPALPQVDRSPDSLSGVVLRFAPFAAAEAERYAPEAQRREKADGSVFIRTHFRSAEAAVRTCLEAGGDIELIRPEELRQKVRRRAEQELSGD